MKILLAVILFLNSTLCYADISTGLITWYKFDEGSGSTANDSSGKGNTGTLQGSPAWVAGKIAGGVGLNGTTQYVTFPDSLIHNLSAITLSVWFNTSSGGGLIGYQNAAYPSAPGSYVPVLYVGTDGKLRAELWVGSISPITSSSTYTNSLWHQAVLTYSSNLQTLYVDGVSLGTLSGTLNNLDMSKNQIGLIYGGGGWPDTNGGWYFFSGSIDDVRVYNRALSSMDVTQLYKVQSSIYLNHAKLNNLKT